MLSKLLSHYWWVLLLRGAFAILFGIVALTYPGITLASLVLYFAAFAFRGRDLERLPRVLRTR